MPRNRRPRDREEKSAEIVAAAAALFSDVGYEKTSMANVARAAGVTTTTIYWYFEDKEALLVAVLDRLLGEALQGAEEQDGKPLTELLLWVVERLTRQSRLVTTVHALADTSPAVGAWHTAFHELTDAVLAEGLRESGVPEPTVPAMTRLGVFAIEGLLLHPQPVEQQRAVLALLTGGPTGGRESRPG